MGKSCSILAHVRNSKGEVVESKLYKDLLHYTSNNRELTKEYYAVGTNEDFLDKVRDSKEFKTDENGEITLKSLRVLAEMDLNTDNLIQILNKDFGEGMYNYEKAVEKVQAFNDRGEWEDKVLATMTPAGDKYYVSIVSIKKTIEENGKKKEVEKGNNERKKLYDVVRNKELEKKIINLLEGHNVSVKFIQDKEKGGRYSTENVSSLENGLYGLIQVNENGYTTDVLAEEAGHFAVGALGEHILVQRLEKILGKVEVQKEALGEEYKSSNLGSNPAREVAGRLVGKALQRKLDNKAVYNIIANRIANLAKRVFYNFTGNEVRWAAAKAEQIANKIAYQFADGNSNFSVQNALSIKETMFDRSLSINQETYREVMDELGRMVKELEAISEGQLAHQMQASQALAMISGINNRTGISALQMDSKVDLMADSLAFDGIVQALVQVIEYIGEGKEIDRRLNAVDLDNPSDFYKNMARNGRYLRQVRTYCRSAEIILNTIKAVTIKENIGGVLNIQGNSSVHDIKYQDENGNWHTIDLTGTIDTCLGILADIKSRLTAKESNYFARFCEDVYGNKYITSTVGKLWTEVWNGEINTKEQIQEIGKLVVGIGVEDIDVFHRYLGSMSNNPDIIGQIVDKAVKANNKNADDMTRKVQERLIILKKRAKDLGLDVEDLVERDDNGIPTGYIIAPPVMPTQHGNEEDDFIYDAYTAELGYAPAINFGKWEDERNKMKEEAWEEFKAKNPNWESLSGFARGFMWDEFFRDKIYNWNKANSLKVEILDSQGNVKYVKWVPNAIYESDSWNKLQAKYKSKNNDSLLKWVSDYLQIKKDMDSLLPLGTTSTYRLPQFRGTFMSSVRNSRPLEKGAFKNVKAWAKTAWRRIILESFVESSEEYDYGDLHTMNTQDNMLGTRLDYEQERAARIPVFGINKLRDMTDLSTDLFHSMLAYASMANSYACLDTIVDSLEVGRQAMHDRKLKGKITKLEENATKIGNFFKKSSGEYESLKDGSKNRAYGRYIKFLDKQVYGISASYYGFTIGKGKRFLLNKLINNISALGGTLFLKGNILGGAVNTLTGFNNVFKEATVADYFDLKDWGAANKYYFKHFPSMWGKLGKLRKDNKLSLFLDFMNFQGDNRNDFKNWRTSRNRLNNTYRILGYLPYSSGDHYMQSMSYLATAHKIKMYDTNGKVKSNMWDAYVVKDNTDEYGENATGHIIEFMALNPISSKDITVEAIEKEGVLLKEATKSTADFEQWLLWQDFNFFDEVYKRDHIQEYNNYRDMYNNLTIEQLMQYKSEYYNTLYSILEKTEKYVNANSPLVSVPTYTTKELEILKANNIDFNNPDAYKNILQITKNEIFKVIWNKDAESAYMDQCREVNNRLHGIYNEQDKTAWHQQWYTNAFLAMKGWALGYIEMMYSSNHYSTILGKNVEGFVNTAAKLPISYLRSAYLGKDHIAFKDLLITMIDPWSKRSMEAMQKAGFSVEQNYNARRMVVSQMLIAALFIIKFLTAKGEDDDDEEYNITQGLIYYLSMRTLIEQEAFLYVDEIYHQTGSLMDFMPVGGAALYDLGLLAYQGIGAVVGDEDNSDFFHQRDATDERYEEGESKFSTHAIRIIPYAKSVWAIQHPYEAAENYQFGRMMRAR